MRTAAAARLPRRTAPAGDDLAAASNNLPAFSGAIVVATACFARPFIGYRRIHWPRPVEIRTDQRRAIRNEANDAERRHDGEPLPEQALTDIFHGAVRRSTYRQVLTSDANAKKE